MNPPLTAATVKTANVHTICSSDQDNDSLVYCNTTTRWNVHNFALTLNAISFS